MTISEKVRTTASADEVWNLLADPETWPQWTPTITTVRAREGDAPVGVGATFEVEQPRLGRSVYAVTEWEPGRTFTWSARRAGVRTTATHVVRPTRGGAEVELGITWSGPGSGLARLLYGRLARRYVALESASLVATAEGRS